VRNQFRDVPVARLKKILLSEMADQRASLQGDFRMIVNDQTHFIAFGDRQNSFGQSTNFGTRKIFGAKLDQIGAAITKLPRDRFSTSTIKIGCINESIEPAFRK